jgi:hypothetical protein
LRNDQGEAVRKRTKPWERQWGTENNRMEPRPGIFFELLPSQYLAPLRMGMGSIGGPTAGKLGLTDVQWNTDQNVVRA